ncbi:hypothetical protein [Spiroplasma monobiae]|uniref:Uncharacterized protein n=1 Tax=Spiroplasma monobiae MQ-1 TaxID=1336748 RepID=A0A2K9LV29_SPISQ|nr:hypothetical protein [Spiroplasma monobiae]AUM62899.1 hypothetical protein SMONO_v1c06500 [Spiroplasma monobiae MQ-1]
MLKLLSLIGTLGVSTSAITPVIVMNEQTREISSKSVEQGIIRINVDNSKHFDSDGKIVPSTHDYKEVLIKAIDQQRAFNKENNVTNFKITNSITRLPGISFDGSLQVGRQLAKLINANEYEVLNMNVTVAKLDNWGNYTYAIGYEAIADGEMVKEDLYGYQRLQSLADFQIKPGYNMVFDTEYTISESIDYTDIEFNSNISLPNLGIDFLASQVIEMFNYQPNNLNKNAIDYINLVLNVKISNANALNVYKAINNNGVYEMGEIISNNEMVKDEYFYVSFNSSDASGTFNMLIKK